MLIEIQRFRRRFLNFRGGNTVNIAVLVLILLAYAYLVLTLLQSEGSMPPMVLVAFQTVLFGLFAPSMLYGAIAGERERRSWDLLLVAPISKSQVVVGKFMGALAALATGAVLFLVPILIAAFSYRYANWPDLFCAEAVSLSFAASVCALTLFFSARVVRPYMAYGVTLGVMGVFLVVIPAFLESVGAGNGPEGEIAGYLQPAMVLMKLSNSSTRLGIDTGFISSHLWGWPQVFLYLAATAIFLGWASNTLNFAENEVKFLPKGHRDA